MIPITIDMQRVILQRYTCNTPKPSHPHIYDIDNNFHTELINVFYNPALFKASNFDEFSLTTILNYLRKTHQLYINSKLVEIQFQLSQLTFKDDDKQYWLPVLTQLFDKFSTQLVNHIQDEEDNLFPYIDSLMVAEKSRAIKFNIKQKIELVNHLLKHDDLVEKSLEFIIDLLENKSSQFYNQLASDVLISRLKVLQIDLLVHAKIEDEVLLPKAIELEIAVLQNPYIIKE